MNFHALAIEDMTPQRQSGYSIGVARFQDAYIEGTWGCWVAPKLRAADFREALSELSRYIDGGVVVHHAPRSRLIVEQDAIVHGLDSFSWTWLDSLVLMRSTWPNLSERCSDLLVLARELGIDCRREDAVEHAVVTGVIAVELAKASGTDMNGLLRVAAASALCPANVIST